jgi:hypothetical protein
MTRADALERGRESFGRRAWQESYAQLSAANREAPLEPEELDRQEQIALHHAVMLTVVERSASPGDPAATAGQLAAVQQRER